MEPLLFPANIFATEILQFASQIDKIPKKEIPSSVQLFLQRVSGKNATVGFALEKLAHKIHKIHPEMEPLIQEINAVAAGQVLPTLPRDLEPMLLTPFQRRHLSKTRRNEVDTVYRDQLVHLERYLPHGYFPRIERRNGVITNPLGQWTKLRNLILEVVEQEPQFPDLLKEIEKTYGTVDGPQGLGRLAQWSADLNLVRFAEKIQKLKSINLQGQVVEANRLLEKMKSNITVLDLKYAKLCLLPPQIWSFQKLKKLDLAYNPLRYISPEIALLSQLQALRCALTLLKELPTTLRHVKMLQILDISDTQIRRIPEWIFEMTKLEVLGLSGLGLQNLSPTIRKLTNLGFLALDRNFLTDLPQELSNVPLITLNISDNAFTTPPEVLEDLEKLEVLACRGLDPKLMQDLTFAKLISS